MRIGKAIMEPTGKKGDRAEAEEDFAQAKKLGYKGK